MRLVYPQFWNSKNIISYTLLPLTLFYSLLVYLRRLFAKEQHFPCKVICIGNATVGGTGKTQIVMLLAQILKKFNVDYIIISKGYKGKLKEARLVRDSDTAETVGDEAKILSAYGMVIATKKILSSLDIVKALSPSILIVDDGLQNPNFKKDFTILAVDADRLFGNGFLIPAGPLRQSNSTALDNINIVIAIGSGQDDLPKIPDKIKEHSNFFYAQIVPCISPDKSKNYFAFTGIGNPERFFKTLENSGLKLSGSKIFPDHHSYTKQDIETLKQIASDTNSLLITTRKDYVKALKFSGSENIICCDVQLLIKNESALMDLLYEEIVKNS